MELIITSRVREENYAMFQELTEKQTENVSRQI